MVCDRCKWVVKEKLEALGLHPVQVDLGEVELAEEGLGDKKAEVVRTLQSMGFDLLSDKKSKTIEKIKTLLVEKVHQQNDEGHTNLSTFLAENLHQDYSSLSNLFSEVEGITLEKYYILLKVEKVKELLVYDELTLSEIAFQLNYSSVAYLSSQFKKVTGLTPSHFKKLGKRKSLEHL